MAHVAPQISGEVPQGLAPILKPPQVNKPAGTPATSIDVHAHFFNARDVPIRAYIEGPVAHSKDGLVADLLRALAPIAEWLGNMAPAADDEFRELVEAAGGPALRSLDARATARVLDERRDSHLARLSPRVYEQLRGLPDFVRLYNTAKQIPGAQAREVPGGDDLRPLDESSLLRAMRRDSARSAPTLQAFALEDPPPYADGVLAFVGYMLSYRWMNLVAYQRAFTSEPGTFGIDQVLGALVDFDHWLMPPPRTAHEDQIKLHQLLSVLCAGYMRPLVAYNPWSDVLDKGKTLARVIDAVDQRGFVGAKIYPPNGYRPYGNAAYPLPLPLPGMPSAGELDIVLARLWTECRQREVPVMAHSGHSMGRDDALEEMAGPIGWEALITESGALRPARANLGHFGGEGDKDTWTRENARLMARQEGAALFADIGYWDGLRCPKGTGSCLAAQRLAQALKESPVVAERLMYGSDWLMLAQERRWDRYPFDVLAAAPAPLVARALYGDNAKRCFPRLQAPI